MKTHTPSPPLPNPTASGDTPDEAQACTCLLRWLGIWAILLTGLSALAQRI